MEMFTVQGRGVTGVVEAQRRRQILGVEVRTRRLGRSESPGRNCREIGPVRDYDGSVGRCRCPLRWGET